MELVCLAKPSEERDVMKLEAYEAEAKLEDKHWWFVVRRELFQRLLKKKNFPTDAAILDVGTSTGTNLRMLVNMGFANIKGLDFSDHAIHFCKQKGLPMVTKGDICDMPFDQDSLNLVVATDIIEHVENDLLALKEIYRVLKPGGCALITVPMFMSLWGLQDDISLHKRRYRRKSIHALIAQTPFHIEESFFFNFLLLPSIWLARKLIKLCRITPKSENDINNVIINAILKMVFRLDTLCAPIMHPPFGVSYLCVLKKPQ